MAPFVLLWLRIIGWRACLVLGVLAIVYGAYVYVKRSAYNEGAAHAIATIEAANKEAERKADAGEDAVAACYRSGRRWVRQSGTCQ